MNIAQDNIAQTTTTNVNGRLAGFSRITVGTGSTASFAKNSGGNIVGMEAADYTTLTNTSSTNGSTVYNLNGNLTYNVAPSGTGLGSLRIQGGSSLVFTGITNAPTLGNSTTGSGSAGLLFGGSSDFTISSNVTSNPIRSVSGNLLIHHWGTGNLTLGGTGGTASGVTNAVVGSGIEKYGTGRLIISGNNTNTSTAPLAVYGGTVQIDRNGAIGNVTTGGSVTLNGGGRLLVDTTNGSVALNNAGANHRNIVIGTGGGTLDVIGGNTVTVSGVISNSLAGNNGAPVTFGSSESNGTIVLSGSGTSSNFNTFLGGVILAGGTVRVEKGEAQTPFSGAGSVTSGSATVTGLSSTAGLVVGQAVSFTGATLPAGTVIQSIDSATQITLTQAATSTNATANVAIAAGGALGRGATNNPGNHNYITFAGGTLQYSATNTTDYSGRFARVANQSFRIDTNGQNVGFAYGLVGADSTLTKLGSGTLTLNGTNTYTGTTTVTAGTLAFGENNRLLSTGAVSVNGGDLAVGTTTQTVGTVTLSSGNITGSTGRLVGSAYNVHSGNISATLAGSGSLTKSTGGTVVLSGNNTFTGATLVSGGTLQAAAAGALGSTSNLTVNTGGTLWLTANNTVNDAADVTLGGGTILKGPGAVSETFGALELTADSSLSFGTAIGTLNFGTYNGGAFKLNVSNFQEGNILTFRTDLSSSIEDTALFGFDNAFSYAWDSSSTTFTITAIPEPSAVAAAIAFLGLAALRGIRRRRTQNSQTEI